MKPKQKYIMIRVTDEYRDAAQALAAEMGHKSLSDMIRAMIDQAQSKRHRQQTAQSLPDPQNHAPAL